MRRLVRDDLQQLCVFTFSIGTGVYSLEFDTVESCLASVACGGNVRVCITTIINSLHGWASLFLLVTKNSVSVWGVVLTNWLTYKNAYCFPIDELVVILQSFKHVLDARGGETGRSRDTQICQGCIKHICGTNINHTTPLYSCGISEAWTLHKQATDFLCTNMEGKIEETKDRKRQTNKDSERHGSRDIKWCVCACALIMLHVNNIQRIWFN